MSTLEDTLAEEADLTSDRAGTISMIALLDEALGDEIERRFVKLSNTIKERIFEDRGPLSSLEAKIDIGYAIGLYGKQTRSTLHCIRKIRNVFAHHHEVTGFNHEEIQNLMKGIPPSPCEDEEEVNDRQRFNNSVLNIAFRLGIESNQPGFSRPTPSGALS